MNRKGFTLIELLATIALLAIIVAIAIPAVNSMIGKNKKNNCKVLNDSVIRAAELYVSDNKYDLIWNNNQVSIGKNQYGEYLNTTIKNPCDNSEYNRDITVNFKNNNGKIELVSDNILPNTFTCCN